MIDVASFISGKRKQSAGGWLSFNAPCCIHLGETQDKRMRGGLKTTPDGAFSYHCFNCRYTASFTPGRPLSFKARNLLKWMGVDQQDIEMLNLESLRHKSIHGLIENNREVIKAVEFNEVDLPEGLEPLGVDNPEHTAYTSYLRNRGINPEAYPYMVSPGAEGRAGNRIVIPFTHNGMMVGSTTNFTDGKTPKYINDMQPGYVFGTDLQRKGWQHGIVVEGVYDALSIDAMAVLHNDINARQVQVIKGTGKTITVVPDQDLAGMALVDKALELGWAVSMPEWPEDVKDVNDAVKKFGRLATLLTILEARETSKIKIELRKKKLVKGL